MRAHLSWRRGVISLLIIVSFLVPTTLVRAQERTRPTPEQVQEAQRIQERTRNGIFVDIPKVYDDSSLQLMLNQARARLAAIQAIDQSGLLARIGAVSGASLTQSSLGISVAGPPIPGSVVTDNSPTGSTTVNTANGGSTSTITNLPVQGTVTTNPQQNAILPPAPANGGLTIPTGSISALDALNEQMQLTFEIANLQLLLEGSLNDRYVKGMHFIKPRTTLGFPITISPQRRYKDAVAVVEVEVQNPEFNNLNPDDRPAVTALLPREKTYNVAALTDHMTSIGGGLVTSVVNGGFSFLRGHKSYYVVQDQDTLAVMREPSARDRAAFSWEFRPVLGQPYVRAGLKQTFVQLAAPLLANSGCFGKLAVNTYWRRVDRKTGVLKEVIPESINHAYLDTIPAFNISPTIKEVTFDDLGSGQLRVSVLGSFLGGTYVRVGNNLLREGSPGFTSELSQIRFVTGVADVAKYKAFLVSRDGTETEIVNPFGATPPPVLAANCVETPTSDEGFRLQRLNLDAATVAGSSASFAFRISEAAGFSTNVNLIATVHSAGGGVSTTWNVNPITPVPNGFAVPTLTVNTVAPAAAGGAGGTPPGDYQIDVAANAAGYNSQYSTVTLHVVTPTAKPTNTSSITTFDDSKSIVTSNLTNFPVGPPLTAYVMVINDRVFGLADAPIERKDAGAIKTFRALVATSLLNGPTSVQLKPLFWDESFATDATAVDTTNLESTTDKAIALNLNVEPAEYLLFGNRLTTSSIVIPAGITLQPVAGADPATLGIFTLTKAQRNNLKQIVLKKSGNDRYVFVTLPTPEGPPKITLTAGGRVVVGTDEIIVTGDTFDDLKSVTFNKKQLVKVPNGKSVKISGLVSAGVTTLAGEPEIVFEFEDGKKNTLKLDVVSSKIETVTRPSN